MSKSTRAARSRAPRSTPGAVLRQAFSRAVTGGGNFADSPPQVSNRQRERET
jgi:hypothetical protein